MLKTCMVEHLEADVLEDVITGKSSGEGAASDEQHLASCPRCQRRKARLEGMFREVGNGSVPTDPGKLAFATVLFAADEDLSRG